MPAGNGGSVTLNIQAQITGYEQSIKRMKQALEQVDPGTTMGKNLKKGLDAAEKQLKNLMKNATPDASSSAQIQKIVSDVNKLGESLADLGAKAQSITGKDLKLDTLGDGVKSVIEDLKNAKNELDTTIGSGVKEFISSSEDLKKAFTDVLGLDVDKLGPDEIFKKVSQAAKEATKDANKATEAVKAAQRAEAAAQTKVNQLEERQSNIKQSESNLTDDKNRYLESYNTLYNQMMNAMKSKLGEGKEEIGKQILDNFFSGLTPKTAKDKVEEIVKAVNDALDTKDFNKTQFKADFLGLSRGQNIYKNEMLSQMQSAKETMIENIKLNEELTPTQTVKAVQLINDDQIEKGVQEATKKLQEAEVRVEREVKKTQEELADASKNLTTAQTVEKTALDKQNVIGDVEAQIQKARADLEAKNKELEERIKALEQERDAALNKTATTVKQEMGGAGRSAQALQISREEANKYEAALEKVKGAEQALGRLKGVVQQWFSVYAAVRMVTKAIKNIISTLTSLDKVITEIAIVTNMTQSELWGQMNSYAKMAQTYAASIEGVYQVSQLYYQQGLQTADVMALTEQTLKMARISGLGYAEATDYMTNAVRAFNMEMTDAQRVVDVYSAVAASSATNTTELAEAMSKTASSAQAVGSSFENTTAMMAVMIESTRESAQNIGSSLKSIISRYGEMKADPSKLVDSEGQEMSLNKVDKALQSVGISIHDAAGQFRDFDDVIMELAASWDSIDRNTQRYIATIMAGNRQQSRFLALVSGYDRLKELSEEAANSENASQLQYLKTLDSIQAKTQQIKTSFQELYVNSGLEKFYKNLLDYGNQIVQTFTRMPKAFNLPILSIAKFGSVFLTLANVVKTAFRVIASLVMSASQRLTRIQELAHKEQLSEAEAYEAEKLGLTVKYNQKQEEEARRSQEKLTEIQQEGENDRLAMQQSNIKGVGKTTGKTPFLSSGKATALSFAANAAGAAVSLYAAGLDEQKDRSLKAGTTIGGALLQGVGGAISGAKLGAALGPWGAAAGAVIGGAMSALPGIIEGIGLASESTAEKVERLNKTVEETNNQALKSKDELKTLDDYKSKYEELRKIRDRDAETHQEWLDLNNEIAANYPQLISYIDQEGNSIIALGETYEELRKIKAGAYEQDFAKKAAAEIAAATDYDTVFANLGIETHSSSRKALDEIQEGIQSELFTGKNMSDSIEAAFNGKNLGTDWLDALMGLVSKETVSHYMSTDIFANVSDDYSMQELSKDIFKYIYENANDSIENLSKGAVEKFINIGSIDEFSGLTTWEEVWASAEEKVIEKRNELLESFQLDIDELGDIRVTTASAKYVNAYGDKIISSYVDQAVQTAMVVADTADQSGLATAHVTTQARQLYNTLAESWSGSEEDLYKYYFSTLMTNIDKYTEAANKALYDGLTKKQKERVDDIYDNLDSYAFKWNDKEKRLEGPVIDEIRQLANGDEIITEIETKWKSDILSERNNAMRAINKIKTNDEGKTIGGNFGFYDIFDTISEKYWDTIVDQFENVYQDINTNPELAKSRGEQFTNIWKTIGQISDETQKAQASAIMSEADLTSLTGIFTVIEKLREEGLNDIADSVEGMTKYVISNLSTEFDMLADSVIKNMSDFEKALSNASKGMDLSTATEMANKLGITLTDFRFENGKYFYNSVDNLRKAYLKQNEDLLSELNDEAQALDKLFKGEDSLSNNNILDWFYKHIGDYSESNQMAILSAKGYSSDQAEKIISYYNTYADEYKQSGEKGSLTQFVLDKITESHDNLIAAQKEYGEYQVNAFLIQNGKITDFYNSVLSDSWLTNTNEDINQAILSGDYSNLFSDTFEAIQPYIPELYKVLSSYAGNAFKNVIETISNGKSFYGTASSEEEKALLESLGADFYDGMNYVIQSSGKDLEFYADLLKQAYDEGKITLQEYNSYYTQFADAIAGENIGDAFIAVAKDYNHISADAANKLATSLGDDINNIGLVYHDLTKDYSINIEEFLAKGQEQYESGFITAEDYNEILKTIDEYDRKNAPETILKNIVDNRTKLTEADIESIAKLLDEDYNVVKEHLQQNADGTYTAGFAYLYSIMDAAGYEYNAAIEESLAKQYDDIITQATGLVSTQTKGYTKVADMKQFETQLANNNIDFESSRALYDWDSDIHAFVLSSEGIAKQWELINTELNGVDKSSDEYYYYTKLANDTTRQLAESAYSQISNLISTDTATRDQATKDFTKAIENYNTWMGQQIDGWTGIDAQLAIDTIQGGGLSAVGIAKTLAGLAGVQLSDSDIQALYRGQVAPLIDAVETVTAGVGEIVSKTTADIIRNAGGDVHEIAGTGQYVVDIAADVVAAYHAIYEELVDSGEATLAELNAVKAKELESGYKVTELGYLSSAAEMSYEQFGTTLASMGIKLTEDVFAELGDNITKLSNGKLRINNFEGFARALGIDTTSDAYYSAFKTYNDSMVSLNKQTEKAITEEVNAIGSAGLGDQINVTYLFRKLGEAGVEALNKEINQWGANLANGILTINDDANLPQIIQSIYTIASDYSAILESDAATLADAIDTLLKSFGESLQKAINGTLTNSEAYNLATNAKSMFGIDLTFTETKEGLKISTEQATQFYFVLKEVDSVAAGLVFDGLNESLTKTGETCESITATLAEITKLEKELANGPDNAEVRERLNLYREIAAVQMNDPSQYSFMDNKLPDMYQGPENYWNAWDEAFKSMKTAAQKGYMSTQDFYNIVNEMSNVARLTGTPIMLMGEELDGSLEKASALIQKGFNALTIVEGQGAQIDLSNMGLQVTGIDDMTDMTDEALQQVAQANIDMLDSMIQLLEVVVAMEDLGKIDAEGDKDNILDINELFDELSPGLFEADEDTQAWAVKILAQAKDNEDLANALETLLIGEQSLEDIIKKLATPGATFTFDEANQYQKILQAFYDAYLNGDYDLENLQQSIIDIFSKEFGDVDTIQVGDRKFAIGYGVTLEPNEDGEYTTTPDNAKFTDVKEALQHQALLDAGILTENIGEYDTETEITTGKKILKDGSSVTIEVGEKGVKYSVPILPGKKYDSFDDAMTAWYNYEQHEGLTTDTKKTWAAGKGWEIPVTTDFSENAEDPFYQIMVEGVRDVIVNLVEGDIPAIFKKIFGLDGGDNGGTPTSTPLPKKQPPTNPKKPHKVAGDEGLKAPQKTSTQEADTSAFDAANAALATLTTTASNLAAAINLIPDNSARVSTLANAMTQLPTGIAERVSALANAINRIPERRTIEAIMRFRVEAQGANVQGSLEQLRIFKSGNVALAAGRQKTLMGELGPELVVSKGRYFVVGQNGAEMVDLDPDAVVFNHLQTKKLLANGKAGRGKAVTNERRATSMATGNASGPAMASAKAALNALKQLRAMWQSLLGASLSDLGALGGSGGGGGGGGGGKDDPTKNNAGFIADLERWYNLLRQIAKLEKDINYEQTLRNKLSSDMLVNGKAYYDSIKRELDALNQTTAKQSELASIQKDFYDKRAKELESSNFGKIFKYDENGQIQYNDDYKFANGDRGGLFALAELNRQNPDGSSALTVEEQYKKLKAWGFENDMLYDSQGQKIEYDKDNLDDFYTKSVQAFWDKADGWKDELDGYYDSFREAEQASVEAQVQANKLLQELQDKEIELQEKVYQAIVDSREKEIQDLQDTADAFSEAADKYIDGLNKQLQREQQMYQNNKNEQDLEKNRRRLAVLQRSGASASEIASLQSTIDDQSKQMYFDKQQQQIDAIQEASDAQIEKMTEQIELMQTALDYEKSNGLLWGQVYEVMAGTPSQIEDFIKKNSAEYQGLSNEQYTKMSTDLGDLVDLVKAYKEDQEKGESPVANQGEEEWKAARAQLATMPGAENFTDEQWAAAKQAYTEAIASGKGADEAYKAAEKVLKGEPKISEDQEKKAKTAAENYFNDTKKTDALKAKYGKDLYATAEAAAKRAYQEKYAEILANGGTVAEAEKAAEEALLDVFVTEERKGTVRNAFRDEEAFKKAVKKKLGKGAKINDDVWADALDDIQDAFETSFMDNGDESAAYAAAAQEYKKQLRITKAEEYWEDWVSKVKKKKKPNSDQKKMKAVLSSNKPIGVEQVNKAHDAFVTNFKGGNKKKKRKNARAAAKKILLDAYKSKSYSQGGIVDYTGIANVHGTRTKPEAFLNADEVKMWRSDILGNHSGSLTSSLLDLNELVHNMVTGNDVIHETTNNGVSIENAVVNMNTTIANDYDAKRAGELALQQMLKIAQKTGNQGLSRR